MRDATDDDAADEDRARYRELLEELRTIIPGAQVLLAFLLTVPFASRFADLDALGRRVFAVSLVASAVATVLFLAPAAYHRVAHADERHRRVAYGAGLVIVGMSLVAVAVSCGLFVVVRLVYESTALATGIAVGVAVVAAVTWYVVPLQRQQDTRGGP